jgi:hypothetical protein
VAVQSLSYGVISLKLSSTTRGSRVSCQTAFCGSIGRRLKGWNVCPKSSMFVKVADMEAVSPRNRILVIGEKDYS